MSLLEALLEQVPDEPANIDFRGLLLEGPELVGDRRGALAVRSDRRLLAVFGRPRPDAVRRALRLARDDAEIVAPVGARDRLEPMLDLEGELAVLHAVGPDGLRRPEQSPEAVLLAEETSLDHLPAPLAEEVGSVLGRRPVAAVLEDDLPVAVCHPALVTERYWDVSIETLPEFRRGGRAAAALLRLAEEMRTVGLEPVWGAVESNVASLRLAQKLGFEPVGELVTFALGRST